MSRPLPPGIFARKTGYRVFVKVRTGRGQSSLKTKTFPPDTPLAEMKGWREFQRVQARLITGPIPQSGTLAADIERYLTQVAAMPTIKWRTRDLYAWRLVFGNMRRSQITAGMIRAQLHAWRTIGPVLRYNPKQKTYKRLDKALSASACNHRRTALLHLWTTLDGKAAPNPVRDVEPFDEPPPAPRARDIATLASALATLRNPKQRARALVLLWTGIRGNSELAKMTAQHVDLEHAVCHVPTGKGGRTVRPVPLTVEGIAAWQAFMEADAWGKYNKDALRKSVRLACQKAGLPNVRTYDLRHSISTGYLRAGADLADVQALLGHTTARMTRRYAPFHAPKLIAAGERLGKKGV